MTAGHPPAARPEQLLAPAIHLTAGQHWRPPAHGHDRVPPKRRMPIVKRKRYRPRSVSQQGPAQRRIADSVRLMDSSIRMMTMHRWTRSARSSSGSGTVVCPSLSQLDITHCNALPCQENGLGDDRDGMRKQCWPIARVSGRTPWNCVRDSTRASPDSCLGRSRDRVMAQWQVPSHLSTGRRRSKRPGIRSRPVGPTRGARGWQGCG